MPEPFLIFFNPLIFQLEFVSLIHSNGQVGRNVVQPHRGYINVEPSLMIPVGRASFIKSASSEVKAYGGSFCQLRVFNWHDTENIISV